MICIQQLGRLELDANTVVVVGHADEGLGLGLEVGCAVDLVGQLVVGQGLASLGGHQTLLHLKKRHKANKNTVRNKLMRGISGGSGFQARNLQFTQMYYLIADLLLDGLELVGSVEVVVGQQLLDVVDGVTGRAHAAHLLACAVGGTRVTHTVAVVAVGVELHVERTLAGAAVLSHHGEALLHSQHVHAVDADACVERV